MCKNKQSEFINIFIAFSLLFLQYKGPKGDKGPKGVRVGKITIYEHLYHYMY